ncbi:Thiamin biosynthesis lipoprotein ApbE [hydrothermal vent metagenome]|uniref:FAD:protein FMN transferase n=1 Tax=hydrothermal vent metagenome TaxID=652676 RepID=A0A3B0ZYJ1_9ZZZZ
MNSTFHPLLTILLISISYLFSINSYADWFKSKQAIMGTEIRLEFWLEDSTKADLIINTIMAEMHRIDVLMSPFKIDSELSKLNRLGASQKVKLSEELFNLINKSITISELTKGAFDVTFASIGNLYDYRNNKKPTQQQIQSNLSKINYKHLILNKQDHSIKFAKSGVVIDLGGIAKGHAVDKSIAILKSQGIQYGLISAGGDTRIIGDHRGRPWVTGIRDPRVKGKSAILIPLSNIAISTSGDYERFFIENGVRYHHIISPKTGQSIKSVRSVSVIGPDSTSCDALSTSLFVLGSNKALKLINQIDKFDAIIIDSTGKLLFSSGLQNPK